MDYNETNQIIKIPKKRTIKKRSPPKEEYKVGEIIIEPGPPIHIPLPVEEIPRPKRKTYCPKGTRRNHKTGNCDPIKIVIDRKSVV